MPVPEMKTKKSRHSGLDPESSHPNRFWTTASAGVTVLVSFENTSTARSQIQA